MARNGRSACVVLSTAARRADAATIARALVSEGLAACVNIVGPVSSVYRWRGAIEDDREFLMVIKTRRALYGKVERRVRELHGYEVPEVIAISVDRGSAPYLDWLIGSAAGRSGKK
jgi:periplasmic divalent cation tolerance protein